MTKQAHITSRPGAELGDRVLGLCGKDFKLKTKWDDIPTDKSICRTCVDMAVAALTEADAIIENARIEGVIAEYRLKRIGDVLSPEGGLILDGIAERDEDHRNKMAEEFLAQHEQEKAQQTCTCTWTSQDNFEVDPECPIHGGHSDAIPVELPEDQKLVTQEDIEALRRARENEEDS